MYSVDTMLHIVSRYICRICCLLFSFLRKEMFNLMLAIISYVYFVNEFIRLSLGDIINISDTFNRMDRSAYPEI